MPAFTPSPSTLLLALALPSLQTARPAQHTAALDALGRLLGRADAAAPTTLDLRSWVALQLGMSAHAPWAAAWQAFADPDAASASAPGACLLLEPVQMVATMNSVAMRPLPLALSAAQLEALVELLNPIFNTDGGQLAAVAGRLLLRLAEPADWQTTPLAQCAGRDLRDCLPRGDEAGLLRRWMTECQMALHRRAEQGDALLQGVTGVWAWGEGSLATQVAAACSAGDRTGAASTRGAHAVTRAEVALFSQDPLLGALATARQQLALGNAADALRSGSPARHLVWHGGEDPAALHAVVHAGREALMRGTLRSIQVNMWLDETAMAQAWLLRRPHLLRVWRRPVHPWDAPSAASSLQ